MGRPAGARNRRHRSGRTPRVSSITSIQLGNLIRVLNAKQELLFWTSKELAQRHIDFGDAKWEKTKRKHRILLWIGAEIVPAHRIVVRLGPRQTKSYERLLGWQWTRGIRFHKLTYVTILIECGAIPVVTVVHRHIERYHEPEHKPVMPIRPPTRKAAA